MKLIAAFMLRLISNENRRGSTSSPSLYEYRGFVHFVSYDNYFKQAGMRNPAIRF